MNKRAPLLVIFLTIFIDLLGFGIIIPILPGLALKLGGDANSLAVAAMYAAMNFLFAPLWGSLSDRFGRRPIILNSIVITAAANFLFGWVDSIWILLIQRSLAGMGSANISAANAYVADISDKKDRAKNMGLIGAAFGLGFIFGPMIGGYFKTHFGIMGVGLVSGGLGVLNLVTAYFFLPESLKAKNRENKLSLDPVSPLIAAMKDRMVRNLFLLNFIFICAFSLMQVTVAVLWEKHYGLVESEIGFMFGFIGLSSAIVQGTLVGPLNKRFGEKTLLTAGFILMAVGMVSLPYFPSVWGELIPLAIIALANGMISPSILSILSGYAAPHEQGRILGLNQSLGSLGRVAGPVLGGPLYAWNYEAPYIGSGILLTFALIFTIDIYRKNIINHEKPDSTPRSDGLSPAVDEAGRTASNEL